MSENSFDARADLEVGGETYEIFRLEALQSEFDVARLPFSLNRPRRSPSPRRAW
jgi:aconitate hydratase